MASPAVDAGRPQKPRQARLDEPEPARRQRDRAEQLGGHVREQDERRIGLGPDGPERGEQGEVVERPPPDGGDEGHPPVRPDGDADGVPLAEQLLPQALRPRGPAETRLDPADHAAR